ETRVCKGNEHLMQIKFGAKSDTGTLRVQNEDSFLAKEKLFVVADGMGGHNAGEVASAMAIKMLDDAERNGIADAAGLAKMIEQINSTIFQASANQTDQNGMGTPLTVLAVTTNEKNETALAVANIGDSRTYVLRGDEFRQVSVDHSYVQELVSEGLITKEEARTHARRNIVTRALGIEPKVAVDTWTLPIVDHDRYLLCSDGLVDEVADDLIEKCLRQKVAPQKIAEELVALANQNGGRDNITVIVVDVLADTHTSVSGIKPKRSTDKKSLVKKLVVGLVGAGVLTIATTLLATYLRSGYFVAYENSKSDARVLVYRGKNFLWVNPTTEADSTLTREDLSAALSKEILAKPGFSSSSAARDYVNQIRDVIEATKP
ncbi:MAG: Stp1/IreP family PP2C-type Ser/Thr phosphatase, partial [Actinomycetota bacterium]